MVYLTSSTVLSVYFGCIIWPQLNLPKYSKQNTVDAATHATVIDILRNDAAEGIGGGAAIRDQIAALRLWQDEVDTYSTTANDYRMAISIARAMLTDRNVVSAASAEEVRATDDRRMALRLAGATRAEQVQGYLGI